MDGNPSPRPRLAPARLILAATGLGLACALTVAAGPAPGAAAQTPAPVAGAGAVGAELHLGYAANWGGAHVADFTLSHQRAPGGGGYQMRFHLETRGLTRWLSGFSAVATTRGRWLAPPPSGPLSAPTGGPSTLEAQTAATFDSAAARPAAATYLPENYRSDSVSADHQRWVEIDFPGPGLAARAATGTQPLVDNPGRWNPKDEGPEELDKIPDTQRTAVVDPLSAVVQMMAGVEAHLKGGPANFSIKGFDGRRRFDLDVQYLGLATRTVGEIRHNTYHVRLTPRPIAGFKAQHRKLWDGATFDFFLLRDGSFVPVQIVPLKHGPVLSLVSRCDSPCELKAEQ